MTDPERLIARTDDEVLRAVLRAGRAERPPPGVHERTAAAMGLPQATGLAPAPTTTAGGALRLARLAKGGALLAVSAGLLLGVQHFSAPSPAAVVASVRAADPPAAPLAPPSATTAADPATTAAPGPVSAPDPAAIAPTNSAPLASAPRASVAARTGGDSAPLSASDGSSPHATGPASSSGSLASPGFSSGSLAGSSGSSGVAAPAASVRSPLALEVAALDQARARLASGDASGALALLDRYQHDFPQGVLQQEALLVRIDALIRAGQRPAALALGEPFLAAHPASPLARRLRSLLGKDPPASPAAPASPVAP